VKVAQPNRIEQFQKMANDDPSNEVAHFSLGREYLAAGQLEAALASLDRCLALNPNISKAYQLAAQALLELKRKEAAITRLTEGARRADERGEMMPRNEMVRMLQDLGAPVPEFKSASQAQQPVGEGQVLCARCHRVAARLPKLPFKGPHAQEIFEKVCADCWREWIPMGTKVINELRLPLNDPQAQKLYDQHMLEFLSLR
jgi:Fe-S cluster biosynthesis and repair protein YggX